jgi:GH18 family chitinase
MIKIEITEETNDAQGMADLLREIAGMVEKGFTSGYYPHWQLSGEEEQEPDPDDQELDAYNHCYYGDVAVCKGIIWTCQTCSTDYCDGAHYHQTSKGYNVECVVCERDRLEREGGAQ